MRSQLNSRCLRGCGLGIGALILSAFVGPGCESSDDPPTCTDANVQTIAASNYDETCQQDSDCVAVAEGDACYPCVLECTNAAINKSALSKYQADVAGTIGSHFHENCNCPAEVAPCCAAGVCHADLACAGGPDAN